MDMLKQRFGDKKMGKKQVSGILFWLGGVSALFLLFLILQSSFLVTEGKIEEAIQVGLAATFMVTAIFSGSFIYIFSILFPKIIPPSFIQTSNVTISAREFIAGFLLFFLIGQLSESFSIFNFAILETGTGLFAQTAGILSEFNGFYLTTVGAPIAEEFLFFIAIPGILLAFMLAFAEIKTFSFFKNIVVQVLIIILVTAPIFAFFHLGQAGLTTFFLAAMIFRAIILIIGSDVRHDFIPIITAGWLFAIGGHMANNIQVTGGIVNFFNQMLFSPTNLFEQIIGLLVVVFFLSIFVVFVRGVFTGEIFKKRRK